jgi:hypothetical protein
MWVYHGDVGRLGAEKAKRMLLTGDTIDGRTAKEWGLVIDAVPEAELEDAVLKLANRMAGVPKNQLMMQKLMINQAYDNMGLANTQMIATLFDGITRHSPEGQWFKHYAEEKGYKEAVRLRDSGEPIPGSKSLRELQMILSPEQEQIRDMLRDFAREQLAPKAAEWDRTSHFPREELRRSANSAFAAWWYPSNGAAPASTTCRWRWRWRKSPPATAPRPPSSACRTPWSAARSMPSARTRRRRNT